MKNIDTPKLVNSLIRSVKTAFKNCDRWSDQSNRNYTHRLFSELDRLAKKLDVDIRRSQKDQNWEFLYDVCFLGLSDDREKNGYFIPQNPLRKVFLVLECEWNPDNEEILYDFSKLLVARSKLRSLVFYTRSCEGFESIMRDVKSAINAFEQGAESDRYLIFGFVHQESLPRSVLLDSRGNELECPNIKTS